MQGVVLIPSLNPQHELFPLLDQLEGLGLRTVVINDGSAPQYENIFEQLKTLPGCIVLTHERNRGKGAALKTGMRYIKQGFPDCAGCVTADADGQHRPADIDRVMRELAANGKFVLGVRDFTGEHVPWHNRNGNRITRLVFRIFTGRKCGDTQSGLRGIPMSEFDGIMGLGGDRYEFELNMLLYLTANRLEFTEITIETVYEGSQSHFSLFKDSFKIYVQFIKYAFSKRKWMKK